MVRRFPPRIFRRVPFEGEVRLRFEGFQDFIAEYSANISLGGIFIKSEQPPAPGTELDVEFTLDDDFNLIRGRGRVIWVRQEVDAHQRPPGMGVRFLELTPGSRELIFQVVDRHVHEGGTPFDIDDQSQGDAPSAADRRPWETELGEQAEAGGSAAAAAGAPLAEPAAASPPATEPPPAAEPPTGAPAAEPAPVRSASSTALDDGPAPPPGRMATPPGATWPPAASDADVTGTGAGFAVARSARRRPLYLAVAGLLLVAVVAAAAWWLRGSSSDAPQVDQSLAAADDLPQIPTSAPPEDGPGGPPAEPLAAGAEDAAASEEVAEPAAGGEPGELPAAPPGEIAAAGEDAEPAATAAAAPAAAGEGPAPDAAAVPAAATGSTPAAQPAVGPAAASRVSRITWREAGGATEVVIWGDGAFPAEAYNQLRLDGASPRLVLRLAGIVEPFALGRLDVGTDQLLRVRTGHHVETEPDELHVVLDLAGPGVRLTRAESEGTRLWLRLEGR